MGTHFYLLFLFQIICHSFIEAHPTSVKVSMAHTILEDHLIYKQNKVIQSIWQQEPSTACDIEKPPVKLLTDKHILQFNFVPYLCVILYDASLRYLELNTSHENTELNSDYAQEIIKKFSADTFCQKMKDNKWFTTIEENKFWVSNFSNDMKNKYLCQRYCVSDIYVYPICAYALGLDLSVKTITHESLRPSSLNSEVPHPLRPAGIPPKKEEKGTSIEKHDKKQVSDAHLAVMESTRLNVSTGNRTQPGVPDERHTFGTVTGRQNNSMPPSGEQVPPTGRKRYFENSFLYPAHTHIKDSAREHEPGENSPIKSVLDQTEKTLATSNGGSLHPDLGKTSGPLEYPAQGNYAPDTYLPPAPNRDSGPGEEVLPRSGHISGPNSVLTLNSSKPEIRNPQKETQNVKLSVSGPDQLVHTKLSGTTSSANPQVASVPEGLTGANIGSSPPVSAGEYNTEGQELVSGDHRASANLVGGNESENGGQEVDASNAASHGDSPKPSVPETPKIPVPSEEKLDQARVNTTVPENVTKEVPGSTLGGLTDTKPDLDHIGKSEPEAANEAIEGDAKGMSGEPDDHEEQNALDDSQLENVEPVGEHGGDQTQDHDEAGLDMDQEIPTESHRYNEGDNDEPSRLDGSTKLSNNNNNKDYPVSDEDEGPWPPGRIPINDAEGGYAHDRFVDAEDSHFFAYFMTMIVLCILGYLIFHNKQKILALALEGRVRKGTRRRPSTSGYRKLDSNLEEAVTSSCTGSSVTHVIY